MAGIGEPPAGIDLTETKYPLIAGILASVWALACIATALRFLCRRLTKSPLWWDDWLIVASLILTGAFVFICICWRAAHGFGRHIWVAPPEAREVWAESYFINVLFFYAVIFLIKSSTLALYWRIFNIEPTIKPLIWILLGILCAWFALFVVVQFLQCVPIRAFWERYDPINPMQASDYVCNLPRNKFSYGNSVINIVTDLFLILLPIPYIWKLNFPWAQRIAIICIFAGGILVVAVSTVRSIATFSKNSNSPDITWNQVPEAILGGVEISIGIVCACLPTLRPLLNLLVYGSFNTGARPNVLDISTIVSN